MGSIRKHFSEGDFSKYVKDRLYDLQIKNTIEQDLQMCDHKDDMREVKKCYEILEGILYDSFVWGTERYSDAHIF